MVVLAVLAPSLMASLRSRRSALAQRLGLDQRVAIQISKPA